MVYYYANTLNVNIARVIRRPIDEHIRAYILEFLTDINIKGLYKSGIGELKENEYSIILE